MHLPPTLNIFRLRRAVLHQHKPPISGLLKSDKAQTGTSWLADWLIANADGLGGAHPALLWSRSDRLRRACQDEMWLGNLSTHQGLSIPVAGRRGADAT